MWHGKNLGVFSKVRSVKMWNNSSEIGGRQMKFVYLIKERQEVIAEKKVRRKKAMPAPKPGTTRRPED